MRAVVLTAYGPADSLEVRDVPDPTPRAGEVLIRVVATTVTMGDTELRSLSMPWLFSLPLRMWLGFGAPRPGTILGMELAGVVEAVGEGVVGFQVGDAVAGASGMGFGTYAELVCAPADRLLVHKPDSVSFAVAATAPTGGLAAVGYLRKGRIEQAKTVLIRGASGSIGTFAVQVAKHRGAHVTGVCGPDGVERVRGLGADVVLDYTQRDFTESDETYDLMLDVVGRMPISRCLRAVAPGGTYVRGTVPGVWELLVALWFNLTSRKRVVLGDAGESVEDLRALMGLLESGQVESVIDRTYPLEQIVDAHRYVETGHKQGHVVVTVARDDD